VSILVVCTANVARSPLAHAMLAASVDVEVDSGGTRARDGDPAAARSQELAAARGLDLEGHRSKPVHPGAIEAADLVVTMSERQRDRCATLTVGAGPKVFTLRELVRLLGAARADWDAPTPSPEALAARAHLARPTAPRSSRAEDVYDPIRDPWPAWVEMAASLDELLTPVLAALGYGPGWTTPEPGEPPPRAADTDRPGDTDRAGGTDRPSDTGGRRWWQTRSTR
jgi:protein-tyrosine phosphatase